MLDLLPDDFDIDEYLKELAAHLPEIEASSRIKAMLLANDMKTNGIELKDAAWGLVVFNKLVHDFLMYSHQFAAAYAESGEDNQWNGKPLNKFIAMSDIAATTWCGYLERTILRPLLCAIAEELRTE